MLPSYTDCSFSAFISYAHADDDASLGWVDSFRGALERSLRGELALEKDFKRVHMSKLNGPIAGSLSKELEDRIAESFSMIIVVGEKYLVSDWCLKELEYFYQRFERNGLEDRLYVLALSESAIERLKDKEGWRQLALPDQVWIPFFDQQNRDEPIFIEKGNYTREFYCRLTDIARDLSRKVRRDLENKTAPPTAPEIYPTFPAAKKVELCVAIGVVTKDLMDAKKALIQALAAQKEITVTEVTFDSVNQYREEAELAPELENAQLLVLPFSEQDPLVPLAGAGGHLSVQKREWERLEGKRRLLWYRPPVASGAVRKAASGADAEFITSLLPAATIQDELINQLRAILAESQPATAVPASRDPPYTKVIMYIESNPNELYEWGSLGQRIREIWKELTTGRPNESQIVIWPRGLNLDELARSKHRLDNADGVILLWGTKTDRSLISQIDLVEDLMPFDEPVVPGFVAYLIPPHEDEGPKVAQGWNVFRFRKRGDRIEEVADETDQIRAFLKEILIRRTRSSELPKY